VLNISSDTTSVPSGAPIVQISQAEYDRLRQLEFSQTGHSSTHISSSGMNPYIVSPHIPWILDSGASSHMIGIKNKFISYIFPINFLVLTLLMVHSLIYLTMGVQATPSLNLINELYAPQFPISLLSISQFTKQNNCNVTFFPPYYVFHDLTTGRKIGSGHERGSMYYLDDRVSPAGLVAS